MPCGYEETFDIEKEYSKLTDKEKSKLKGEFLNEMKKYIQYEDDI